MRFTIDTLRSLKEPPKTPEEIQACTAARRPEGAVPADWLHQVLAGHDGPAQDLTQVLAEFFGVAPASYLGTDAEVEAIDAGLEFLREYRDPATGTPFNCGGWKSLTPSRMRWYSELMRSTRSLLAERIAGAAAASEQSAHQPAAPRLATP